jgi:hypothetical protein
MATKSPQRPADQIVKAISEKSKSVRDFATELSNRIVEFQDYLAHLPGRVEATTSGLHPDNDIHDDAHDAMGDYYLIIALRRHGKEWVLETAEGYADDDRPWDWKPLHEASLKVKIAAVKLFPDLLQAIETSQDRLVAEIMQAMSEYDSFAARLKKPSPEAKTLEKEGK